MRPCLGRSAVRRRMTATLTLLALGSVAAAVMPGTSSAAAPITSPAGAPATSPATAPATAAPTAAPAASPTATPATAVPAAAPSATKHGLSAGCLPHGAGYLRARIRGAIDLDIDWRNAQLECEGGARPSGGGILVSFAGPLPRSGKRVRMIFGIGGTGEGRSGRALPTNVTVIFEGERRLFSTRGENKCTVDNLRQEKLGPPGGAARSYRVVARGFCFEPVSDMIRNERIVISRFDFAGRIAFP